MNKHVFYRSNFHRWIVDEWNKVNRPSVMFIRIGGTGHIRLWEHKCGKVFIVYGTGGASKV